MLLIAGPTASGKSALALTYAKERDAIIVNADSMQVYADLRVITARPSIMEERERTHYLFGTIDGAIHFSVGHYVNQVREILTNAPRPLVFVGGTGLYFRALTKGLSEIPAVPEEIRQSLWQEAEGQTTEQLHAQLDPLSAERLRPSDRQRILRALEVFRTTGVSLVTWAAQGRAAPVLAAGSWHGIFLAPTREVLAHRIERRFAEMLAGGALEEVAALEARRLDPRLPILRAHGVPPLLAHLRGELTLAEATDLSIRNTRTYARRQFTWARHQLANFDWIVPPDE